nr:MAG TPA: hypothetical protein [Caudoviricetes sp.]
MNWYNINKKTEMFSEERCLDCFRSKGEWDSSFSLLGDVKLP